MATILELRVSVSQFVWWLFNHSHKAGRLPWSITNERDSYRYRQWLTNPENASSGRCHSFRESRMLLKLLGCAAIASLVSGPQSLFIKKRHVSIRMVNVHVQACLFVFRANVYTHAYANAAHACAQRQTRSDTQARMHKHICAHMPHACAYECKHSTHVPADTGSFLGPQ